MLGSDAPFTTPANQLTTLEQMQLPAESYARVVAENARRTLGLRM